MKFERGCCVDNRSAELVIPSEDTVPSTPTTVADSGDSITLESPKLSITPTAGVLCSSNLPFEYYLIHRFER